MASLGGINQSVELIKAQRECQSLQKHYDELLHRCVAVSISVLQCDTVWCSLGQLVAALLQRFKLIKVRVPIGTRYSVFSLRYLIMFFHMSQRIELIKVQRVELVKVRVPVGTRTLMKKHHKVFL